MKFLFAATQTLWISIILSSLHKVKAEVKDYCSTERFEPVCDVTQVIVVTQARYGRMRSASGCMSSSNSQGCYGDALEALDEMCSNRGTCSVEVHAHLAGVVVAGGCQPDVVRYLEAEYTCVQVYDIDSSQCEPSADPISVTSSVSISSNDLVQSDCGSSSVRFAARQGQKLNVSIIDFSPQPRGSRLCTNYAELRDVTSGMTHEICAGAHGRSGHVWTSSGFEVIADFYVQDRRNQQFILQFHVVGCADIPAREGTWTERVGDVTTSGCHGSKHTWTLRCEAGHWTGAVGTCGVPVEADEAETAVSDTALYSAAVTPALAVFVLCTILIFLSSIGFLVAVCLHSRRAVKKPIIYRPAECACTMSTQHSLMSHDRSRGWSDVTWPPHMMVSSNGSTTKPGLHYVHSDPNVLQHLCDSNQRNDPVYNESVKYYILENPNETNETVSNA